MYKECKKRSLPSIAGPSIPFYCELPMKIVGTWCAPQLSPRGNTGTDNLPGEVRREQGHKQSNASWLLEQNIVLFSPLV